MEEKENPFKFYNEKINNIEIDASKIRTDIAINNVINFKFNNSVYSAFKKLSLAVESILTYKLLVISKYKNSYTVKNISGYNYFITGTRDSFITDVIPRIFQNRAMVSNTNYRGFKYIYTFGIGPEKVKTKVTNLMPIVIYISDIEFNIRKDIFEEFKNFNPDVKDKYNDDELKYSLFLYWDRDYNLHYYRIINYENFYELIKSKIEVQIEKSLINSSERNKYLYSIDYRTYYNDSSYKFDKNNIFRSLYGDRLFKVHHSFKTKFETIM